MVLSEPLHQLFVGRQPILDLRQEMAGYELLFRQNGVAAAQHAPLPDERHSATATVVCAAFAELGLASALGRQRAFINADANFLHDDALELLPARAVVLELNLEDEPDAALLDRCRALRERGYTLALSDYTGLDARSAALLPLVEIVKIDIQRHTPVALAALAGGLARLPLQLLAQRVETLEQMQICRHAGFHLFQGYYFAQPALISGRKLSASQLGLIRLINLVARDADASELEEAFKHEPGLTVNLLRLVNAVGVGLGRRVGSLRQAVAILGRRQLMRWLQLLLMASPENGSAPERTPLLQLAALRGRLLELLAARCRPQQNSLGDEAFLVGIMSLVPVALGLPMAEILTQIAVADAVRAALLEHDGDLGRLLALVEHFDANDSAACDAVLAESDCLGREDLSSALAEALAWIHGGETAPE